ncbi:MAG: 8-amino-7-oxononanoate synthase [Bacteroidetes bacterium]|nr:MAG: 8-amino-7-oxononanoate synthase [Bacteroidota bacterium]
MFYQNIATELEKRKQEGSLRKLSVPINGIDFYSNDYLGLAQNQELIEKINQICNSQKHKLGSTGSRLLSGNSAYFEELECYLAQIFESESTLIFNSGYMANVGVFSCLPKRGDTILYDELSHACIKDGMRLSFAEKFSFKHNDLNDLEIKLKRAKGQIFIATESVFSMDGDFAPLAEMEKLSEKYNAQFIVDEAHSTGVFGQYGSGLVCHLGLSLKIPIRIHTFGKAIGTHGACVTGPKILTEYLINFSRPFIYTTAMPFHNLVSIKMAFEQLTKEPDLQHKLYENIAFFKNQLQPKLKTIASSSAVQVVLISGNETIKNAGQKIQEQGFIVKPILSPTVKKGSERLRICLHSYNTELEIKELCDILHGL